VAQISSFTFEGVDHLMFAEYLAKGHFQNFSYPEASLIYCKF
jgi:hypothetical protein